MTSMRSASVSSDCSSITSSDSTLSSATLRASSSTMSPSNPSSPASTLSQISDIDMSHITYELEITGIEDAQTFMTQIETGGADEFAATTHLKVTFDSTDFGDFEDDMWCQFFIVFGNIPHNLNQVTIIIRGTHLFTRNNYIKPAIFYSEVVTPGTKEKKEEEKVENKDDPETEEEVAPSSNKSKKSKKSKKKKQTRSAAGPSTSTPAPAPVVDKTHDRLVMRRLPANKVDLYIYEKAMIKLMITTLSANGRQIPTITIRGPMELALRRDIIIGLNHNFFSDPILRAEAGFAPEDRARVAPAEAWERSHPEMRCIGEYKQNPDDFGLWNKTTLEEVNKHGLTEWVVPTGKGGRTVMGFRVSSSKVWKGPST